jgi:transcriptional regulator with XRE-family HTH domain
LAEGLGRILRTIRLQWRLSLRDVEQCSRRIARERGDLSYEISASWLARLENGEHELMVNKLIALAEIYSIPIDQLIRSIDPGNADTLILAERSSPNETLLLAEDPQEPETTPFFPPFPVQSPGETTLLATKNGQSRTPYRRAIIGRLDLTLDPMIPPGSIVQIDTRQRAISSRKNWTHEFQRPIYFLMTREGYVCGWCELDGNSEWLTLIPHPLSPASSRRWKYRTEIGNLGRVIAVAIRSGRMNLAGR